MGRECYTPSITPLFGRLRWRSRTLFQRRLTQTRQSLQRERCQVALDGKAFLSIADGDVRVYISLPTLSAVGSGPSTITTAPNDQGRVLLWFARSG